MSASTISRWNAIPLSRPDEPNLKRPRSEDEQAADDDDDDDISIASRTPSPPPDAMDVDGDNLSKYDEYIGGAPREVITVETKIKPTNKGFALLAKLGWSDGQPLGLSADGRVDPIPFQIKRDLTGLGKTSQDVRMIETTVSQRRGLDSERQRKETEDQRRAREDSVARRTALESELSTTLKSFYCSLCDKQFKNVAQYDEHTNSYAHHHKARFRDMQASVRAKDKEEVDKRKEKERKREAKELRKIAAANGIKMAKPVTLSTTTLPQDPVASTSSTIEVENSNKSAWASMASTDEQLPFTTQSGFKKSGWATVGSTSQKPSVAETSISPVASTSTSDTVILTNIQSSAPAFRTAGWTSLDTGSSQTFRPPATALPDPPLPAPINAPPHPTPSGGWSNLPSVDSGRPLNSWSTQAPTSPPNDKLSVQAPLPPTAVPASTPIRSGWQQFQKSGPKRR